MLICSRSPPGPLTGSPSASSPWNPEPAGGRRESLGPPGSFGLWAAPADVGLPLVSEAYWQTRWSPGPSRGQTEGFQDVGSQCKRERCQANQDSGPPQDRPSSALQRDTGPGDSPPRASTLGPGRGPGGVDRQARSVPGDWGGVAGAGPCLLLHLGAVPPTRPAHMLPGVNTGWRHVSGPS